MPSYDGRVHRFNQNIIELLREKNKSVNALAAYLNYDATEVGRQLRSEQTFPFGDLVKICLFLGQLPADFFYEREPVDVSGIRDEMKGDHRLQHLRMRETRKQIVRYFERKVEYN